MEFKKEIIENRQREEEQYKVSICCFFYKFKVKLNFQIMQCTSECYQSFYIFSFSSYINANLYYLYFLLQFCLYYACVSLFLRWFYLGGRQREG